jgi:hypothetical protein
VEFSCIFPSRHYRHVPALSGFENPDRQVSTLMDNPDVFSSANTTKFEAMASKNSQKQS